MRILSNLFLGLFLTAIVNISYGQSKDVGDFSGLRVSSGVNVKLIHDDHPHVTYRIIKGDERDLVIENQGNDLIVKIKSKQFWSNQTQAEITVYYTTLTDISVSSGSKLKCDDPIDTDEMDLSVSSGAMADIELIANKVSVDVSAGSNLKLEGSAKNARFDASSGASIRARRFVCENVRADGSSGASIAVHATKKISADASSGASIKYAGNPEQKDIDNGWSGQISKM